MITSSIMFLIKPRGLDLNFDEINQVIEIVNLIVDLIQYILGNSIYIQDIK